MSEFTNDSQPVECYKFTVSGVGIFYRTSGESYVVAEGDSYAPMKGLKRSNIQCAVVTETSQFTVELPSSDTLAKAVAMFETPSKTILEFKRYQKGNLSVPTFRKTITLDGASITDELCTLKFSDPFQNATATALPKHYSQGLCNWEFGDSNCQKTASGMDLTFLSAHVLEGFSLSPRLVRLDVVYTGTPFDTSRIWRGAVLEAERGGYTERRTIVFFAPDFANSVNGVATVNEPFTLPIDSDTIVRIGRISCDKSLSDCTRFDNVARFGGFPYMPTEKYNPFSIALNRAKRAY